ncbi:MFS transporter [Bauldia sp.]|uniref:MFS transporter n=1 Tax=Bauldia sp. TaxID=2575872 RepID=UPI003BAA45D4
MDTTTQRPLAAPALFRARAAISAAFLLMGFGVGLWAGHIPIIQDKLSIDLSVIGFALLTMAIGAMVSMPLSGWVVGHIGSRRPTAIAMIAYLIIVPTPLLAGTVPLLFVAAFFFGFSLGAFDVVANVQASEIETARGRPTMSSFHAFYSIGTMIGAAAAGFLIFIGWSGGFGAAFVCVFAVTLGVGAAGRFYPSDPKPGEGPHFALPNRVLFGLGAICFFAYAIEGAVTDWSALYLTDVLDATPARATTGLVLFSLAMAGFRLFGDPIVERLGRRAVLAGGGVICSVGLAITIAAPWPLLASVGFGLVGVGAANIVPVLFSWGARTPGIPPGVGVAAIATTGYLGFLSAPPILGFIADGYGLSTSLFVVLIMGLVMAVLGFTRKRPPPA